MFFWALKSVFLQKEWWKKNDEIQPSAQNASKEPTRYVPLPLNKQFLVFFPFVLNWFMFYTHLFNIFFRLVWYILSTNLPSPISLTN